MASSRLSTLSLVAGALLLVSIATSYTGISIYYYSQMQSAGAHLGIEYGWDLSVGGLVVKRVITGAPAEKAGLRAADVVVAVNGKRLADLIPFFDAVQRGHPGEVVQFSVRRSGEAATLDVRATLDARPVLPAASLLQRITQAVMRFYPVPGTLVGLAVLLMRIRDRHAWLFALVFCGLATGALAELQGLIHPALRGFVLGWIVLLGGIWPPAFYALLATFPAPSPLERRLPWLKTALLGGTAAVYAPLAAWCFVAGSTLPLARVLVRVGGAGVDIVFVSISLGSVALGFVSLALNCVRGATPDARRKARLLAWTFAVGCGPWLALDIAALFTGRYIFSFPFWVWAPCVLLLMLLPVMFAYAVLKHRVMEFSVLVRRSARYVLVQRGFALAAVALSVGVTALFAVYGATLLPRLTDAALPVGIGVGALFGLVVVRTGGAVAKRVERRIDRAFFRQAYDARKILEDLAQEVRKATSREQLATLLEAEVTDAFHPRHVAVYLAAPAGGLELARGASLFPRALSPALPLLETVTAPGSAWGQISNYRLSRGSDPGGDADGSEHEEADGSRSDPGVDVECLVPLMSRRAESIGLMVLGPRLSEEPYSRDDKRLLASVAGQAGLAFESLMLAEEMAERIDAERRAAQEVAIAGEVQRRLLLPQKQEWMATVDYAGECRQARTVGGDYYDFLDLGPGQLGLVLGDVSGKGLYAALLMANLQANLRSLSARAADGLAPVLERVNHSFWESTAGNHYATLFVARYDDRTRRINYANCGHHPPVLLRAGGGIERLPVTAGAIGMFEPWACETRELDLGPGDLLAVFSDGVTEATNAHGEEFGEARLLAALETHRQAPASGVLDGVMAAVLDFSAREQFDDVTLVVARGV